MTAHCCESMAYHTTHRCETHPNPYDCPDQILIYVESQHKYGIIIHDGGTSMIAISFCPFCGTQLNGKT